MRLGLLINLAPRKLGSTEALLVGMAKEAIRRGHSLDVFGRPPIHPEVEREFKELGVGWETTDALELNWMGSVRRLAEYDLLQVHMFQPRTLPALMAFAAWPAKVMVVLHTDPLPPEQETKALRQVVSRALDQVSLFRADALVAVSEYVRQRGIQRFGLPIDRTHTIYNGVDLQRFQFRTVAAGNSVNLLTIAMLYPHKRLNKGVDVLIKAVALLKGQAIRAQVAGDGPLFAGLLAQSHQLGVGDRVEFLGLRNDVPALLQKSDLVVHPATCQDANPFTNLEAMASGVPVIASSVGGVPEIVVHEKTGLLVPPGNPQALADAIQTLADDPGLRQRFGEAGRARVETLYTLERCVGEYLDCTERVAKEGWRSRPRATRREGKTGIAEVVGSREVAPSVNPGKNVLAGDQVPRLSDE